MPVYLSLFISRSFIAVRADLIISYVVVFFGLGMATARDLRTIPRAFMSQNEKWSYVFFNKTYTL